LNRDYALDLGYPMFEKNDIAGMAKGATKRHGPLFDFHRDLRAMKTAV
jgi:hypothetical protein